MNEFEYLVCSHFINGLLIILLIFVVPYSLNEFIELFYTIKDHKGKGERK